MGISPRVRRVLWAGPVAAVLGLAAFTAHVGFGLGGSGSDWFFMAAGRRLAALLDALWPASVILIGFSAWQPARIHREASFEGLAPSRCPMEAAAMDALLASGKGLAPAATPA